MGEGLEQAAEAERAKRRAEEMYIERMRGFFITK